MKLYVAVLIDEYGEEFVFGYATTEEKAQKMVDILRSTDGFENYDFRIRFANTDTLIVNDTEIKI